MKTLLLLFAILATGVTAAEEPTSDKARLEGDWVIEICERDGEPDRKSLGDFLSIQTGKARFIDKDDPCNECEFVVAVFPDESPKQLDFKYTGDGREDIGPGEDTMHGIYEFQGDLLFICMGSGGDPRPKEFKTKPGEETTMMLLRRRGEP